MDTLSLTYSLADQDFSRAKSVGIFNVSTQLLEHLAWHIGFSRLNVMINSSLEGKLRLPAWVTVKRHNEAIRGKLGRILWDQWGVYKAARTSGNQWLFLPKGFAAFSKPPGFRLAVYMYDTIHDFYRDNYPGVMPWFESVYFTRSLRATFKYADVIFTDSDFAKSELERAARRFKIGIPPVITAGVGFSGGQRMAVSRHNSLLLLTSVWPHKLTERAISFLTRWQKQVSFSGEINLVGSLPGSVHLPRVTGWRHYPRLSETKYRQFLAETKVLLFFSSYEGFGMPPVESMIAGACPVFSDLAVTREVMGEKGYSFSNDSYESFARAMEKSLSVSEETIQLWAKQLLQRHNWDNVVRKVADGLQ